MQEYVCEHLKRVGDHYGVSCQDCGAKLEGYGYGGWFGRTITSEDKCIHHVVVKNGDECIYCHRERLAL
jgi:hypothetical protein